MKRKRWEKVGNFHFGNIPTFPIGKGDAPLGEGLGDDSVGKVRGSLYRTFVLMSSGTPKSDRANASN
jgi:hypothetical protein